MIKYRIPQGVRSKHLFYSFQVFDRNSRNAFIGYEYIGNLQIAVQNKKIGIARLLNRDIEPRRIVNTHAFNAIQADGLFENPVIAMITQIHHVF